MATTTSKLATAINYLADALAARPGLAGVQVASGWLGADTSGTESIQITDGRSAQAWAALGRQSREETLTITVAIWVRRAGGGEAVIRETRARAFALLAELEDQLRGSTAGISLGGAARSSQITGIDLNQGANPGDRWCQIDATIEADKRLISS